MKNHYIISFNDLSKEKQEEIKKDLVKRLNEDIKVVETTLVFDDPKESIEETVQRECDRTWVEWEVCINS